MRFEYRVRWRRKSRTVQGFDKPFGNDRKVVERQEPERSYSAIYQSEKGAREKAERLVGFDGDKHLYADEGGHNPFDFPDLTDPPSIERRGVGEWEAA